MLKMTVALCSTLLVVTPAFAESAERPAVKPGDTWSYQTTLEQSANQMMQTPSQWSEKHYEITVIRSSSTGILVSRKERGSKLPPLEVMAGSDWSKYKSINGEETIINQPLKFPLEQGKSWELKFLENNPSRDFKSVETRLNYVVAGWEEVSVPAGLFKALKIEADGKWKSERESSTNVSTNIRADAGGVTTVMQANKAKPAPSTGRMYRAYWYVPEAKIYVKSIEENFFSDGSLSRRSTEELESFKLSQ
ncbi:MAG: hypothetical protein WCK63_16815 [Betaproteobacteria bacterium]